MILIDGLGNPTKLGVYREYVRVFSSEQKKEILVEIPRSLGSIETYKVEKL